MNSEAGPLAEGKVVKSGIPGLHSYSDKWSVVEKLLVYLHVVSI